ncbi:MAG: diphosphomevalonate decarboxylase, partial [Candidatus Aenigmatarchaeota archaeon]
MKASAVANANVALVKYWGKRDPKLMLPQNSSISVTLDGLYSHTTVEFGEFESDQLIINGKEFGPGQEEYDDYVGKFLAVVRELAGTQLKAKIVSQNNFPTGAGLASSAAGFAALALACSKALGLPTDPKSLSILARRGSGSATRSVLGGFVEWKKGEKADGSDSYAEQIADENHWPEFRILAVITSRKEKKVKSRAGMAQTVKTCPFYPKWLETVEE